MLIFALLFALFFAYCYLVAVGVSELIKLAILFISRKIAK